MATTTYTVDFGSNSTGSRYFGLAFDADGNVYASSGTADITKFDSSGTQTSAWASITAGDSVRDIVCDDDGNVYATSAAGKLFKITPAGSVSTLVASLTGGAGRRIFWSSPYLWLNFSSGGSSTIYRIDPTTGTQTGYTTGGVTTPFLISDGSGGVYFTAATAGKMHHMTSGGTVTNNWSSGDMLPGFLTKDPDGNFYSAQWSNSSTSQYVSKTTSGGTTSAYWVDIGSGQYPTGAAAGLGGYLYTCPGGTYGTSVYKVNLSDGTKTSWKTLSNAWSSSILVDAQNVVWIADFDNDTVYRIDDDLIALGGGTVSLAAAADFTIEAAATLSEVTRTTTSISAAGSFTVETSAALKRALKLFISTPVGGSFTVEADGCLLLDVPLEAPPGGLWDDDLNDWVFEPNATWEPEV